MTPKKQSFDEEVLALRRLVRIIEEFPDSPTRARLARYIADRYPAAFTEADAERLWNTPLPGSLDLRANYHPDVDPRQEKLPLEPRCEHGADPKTCFVCDVDRQVERERHSAPPVSGPAG